MSADIKWEAVESGDLNAGDDVRLLHDNGDVIHAEVFEALGGKAVAIFDAGRSVDILAANGYRFERAATERTLPTEKGWYSVPNPGYSFPDVIGVDEGGWWVYGEGGHRTEPFPKGAVRLVPVTEADELRKRIEKVHDTLDDSMIWDSDASLPTLRTKIRAALDGEA